MEDRELFADGPILISIPYHWLQTMTRNLEEMKIHLPSHESKGQYLEEFGTILKDLADKAENP